MSDWPKSTENRVERYANGKYGVLLGGVTVYTPDRRVREFDSAAEAQAFIAAQKSA